MKKNKKIVSIVALGLALILSSVPAYAERNNRDHISQAYFYQDNFTDFSALSNYILPISNQRKVTVADLKELSTDELALARNEIYARYGKTFETKEIQAFFNQKSWYKKNPNFQDSSITQIEKENAAFIRKIEKEEASRRFLNIKGTLLGDTSSILFDMNGDAIKDNIKVSIPKDNQLLFQIGTASLNIKVEDLYKDDTPPTSLNFIKLRDNDEFKDLIFSDGSSNDYGSCTIIRYDGNRLYEVDSISFWDVRLNTIRLNGEGEIRFQEEDITLGNYKKTSAYQLTNGKFKDTSSTVVNVFSKALQPIALPVSPSSNKMIKIQKGEKVLFRRHLGLDWYEILSESGKIGWIQMKNIDSDGALINATYKEKDIDGYWFSKMSYSG